MNGICIGIVVVLIVLVLLWVLHPGGRKAALKDYNRLAKEHGHTPMTRAERAAERAEEERERKHLQGL